MEPEIPGQAAASWPDDDHPVRPAPPRGAARQPVLRVVSHNLRLALETTTPADLDHWPRRSPVALAMLVEQDADVIGLQEATPQQIWELDDALGPTHLRIGTGRETDGGGEHNPLYLRRDRFAVESSGQFWLSPDPEAPGSTGWDAACPRICVWARVADLRSGGDLVLAVTHLDHISEDAQVEGARLIAQRLAEIGAAGAGADPYLAAAGAPGPGAPEVPMVLMGDFNCAAGDSEPWRVLREAGFHDAHDIAAAREGEDIGTFPDYGPGERGGVRIDWVLVRGLRVSRYRAEDCVVDGTHASDHATVSVVLSAAP